MSFTNRVRLPIFFDRPQYPMERSVFRKADGSSKVLSMVIRNTFEGKTDQLPEDWHRKLVIALAHDTVTIEGERFLSAVALDGDYEIDWQDFLSYPIAQAAFRVQVTPFDATNSNCQTCEEMAQLNLVDDVSTDTWAEGTTHTFPDVVTDNDEICCNPFVITLVSYNAVYFSSVTIDPATGILTATVQNTVPDLTHVLMATYRVTCPDGSYDEADVYINLSGSGSAVCAPPIGPLSVSHVSGTSVYIDWDEILPNPTCGWIWELYLTSDLGTILQSGNVMVSEVTITGLTTGEQYTVVVKSDCCAYDYSTSIEVDFVASATPAFICGDFQVTYLPNIDTPPQSISYMDCEGNIQNETFVAGAIVQRCMLLPYAGATVPLYFVASTADITINKTGTC